MELRAAMTDDGHAATDPRLIRLSQLNNTRTPGPWLHTWTTVPEQVRPDTPRMDCVTAAIPESEAPGNIQSIIHCREGFQPRAAEDAEFIAELANEAGWLIEQAQENSRLVSRVRQLEQALAEAAKEAINAQNAIWSKEVASCGKLHDSARDDSASAAFWRLHDVVRAVLPGGQEPA